MADVLFETGRAGADATARRVEAAKERLGGLLQDFRQEADPEVRAKLAGQIRALAGDLADRGGAPKTGRIEHSGHVATTLDDIGDLLEDVREAAEVAPHLRVIDGG